MKAFEDLINDECISLYTTTDTMYYIGNGVKIERNNITGVVKIYNVLVKDLRFEEVDQSQYLVFENEGWINGCAVVNIDFYTRLVNRIDLIDETTSTLMKIKEEYLSIIDKYSKLITNKIK